MKLKEELQIQNVNPSIPLSLEETVAFVDSFGVMTKDELLKWGYNKIDEIWEEKHGGVQQSSQRRVDKLF